MKKTTKNNDENDKLCKIWHLQANLKKTSSAKYIEVHISRLFHQFFINFFSYEYSVYF